VRVASRSATSDRRTDQELARLAWGRLERRALAISSDHAPIPANPPPARPPLTISRGHVVATCPDARPARAREAAAYIIKQTARASRLRPLSGGRAASFAERQCVGPDYWAPAPHRVRRRMPDRFRSYLAPPAPTPRPTAPSDVTRGPAAAPAQALAAAYISSPCDAPPPTQQINGPQIRTVSARIMCPPVRAFCTATFYDYDDPLFFTFTWLMLIAKIKAATRR